MISPLLTPFRWYDKYHQQNRFESECADNCTFELITDCYHLLPFQFKRDKNPFLITDWVLRRCCDDPNRKMLDKVDSNFVSESMSWDNSNSAWNLNPCGGMCANVNLGLLGYQMCWTGLTTGNTYTANIFINSFNDSGYGHGAFNLIVTCGSTIGTYASVGLHTVTFVASSSTFCLSFPPGSGPEDLLCVSYVQIEEAFTILNSDIILQEGLIKYFNQGDYDYFVYCGQNLNQRIPPGCYYSIIQDEDGNLYFSEVITVKDFIAEKSPYLLFEWWNSCDIKDTIYKEVCQDGCCSYKNKLYLSEAVVTKPDYPFKEEGEEDGNQSFNATFQKLDKNILLIAPRVPEYIIDALNGVRLHDTIQFTNALRLKQEFVDDPIDVISVEADTAYIINDCFANVTLKCLLDEKYVDETCCVVIQDQECHGCVEIPAINEFDSDVYEYALVLTEGSDEVGLYKYVNNEWVLQDSDSDILICESGTGFQWQYQPDNPLAISGYVKTPHLLNITYVSGNTWHVYGNINTFSFGIVEYSTNGGLSWTSTLTKFSAAQFQSPGLDILLPANPCCGQFDARVVAFDINGCDYGTSNAINGNSPTNDCC